ncbi:DNA helicase UvrD [Serinibacter arcticus]|uniref:DNA 3'-5' helicase n=1 Tax=Serinibacter arcticus TaxID=1655435 RepID=A0A2U1ZQW9_9MICO|nr:UvrD-helicase domain-containing protein [Serinibacter arcticus]PWD49387.1 DNA helicase UvrD [Serinibacter arcticus]
MSALGHVVEPDPDLVDEADRTRITTEVDSSLFVEAGAGSGKTRALVERIRTLVLVEGVPLRRIAAVTFTEKAGAELRDRLRADLEEARRDARDRGDGAAALRADHGLEDLDSAAIGTLHSFAQRLLGRHPVEAGLPPLVEVSDEVGSGVAFDERWSVLRRELLDDEDMSQRLLLAMAAGVTFDHLRQLTRAFNADWDLVADRVLQAEVGDARLPDPASLAARATALAARAAECANPADKFVGRLAALGEWAALVSAAADDRERFAALKVGEGLSFAHGVTKSWPDLPGLREECKDLVAEVAGAVAAFTDATLRPLARWIAERVVRDARARAARGTLEFHDLLVLSRELLRTDEDVRASLQAAFPRLLLDEFQDTDPIQVELAVRIAAGAAGGAPDWRDVRVPPGSLFVVGDPKQSIYRFRRADIRTFLGVRSWMGPEAGATLSTNFRTTAPILEWVNGVFGELIQAVDGAQPSYVPLDAHRPAVSSGPAVTVLAPAPHEDLPRSSASILREREAADVAGTLARAHAEGWAVQDERTKAERAMRWGDVAILVPARTSLPFLEEALEHRGIPYRAESSSLVYSAPEVRDLMAAARAVADPGDQLAVVTALRSPLYGCGDDDLWTWRRDGGSFHLLAPREDDDGLDEAHPVAAALAHLREVHRWARWTTPSEVLGRLVADRRMLEVPAHQLPRARDVWRQLRFVVDQARAWSEVEHGGLRAYLTWAARQADESSRVAEAVLPETDVDAVRIMTVHAAKGLEFPVVALSGLTSRGQSPRGVRVLWTDDGGWSIRLKAGVQTEEFTAMAPLDEQMDSYERRRLLYVAATRARDHLVVSLHRDAGRSDTSARLLAEQGGASGHGAVATPAGAEIAAPPAPQPLPPVPDLATWQARTAAVRAASRAVVVLSPSGLEGTEPDAPFTPVITGAAAAADARDAADAAESDTVEPGGAAKGARDLQLPPWSKGRYGTAIGRAVHGVLQSVDLASGAGLDAALAAQVHAEAVTEHADVVEALVRSALASDLVRRAAEREHWAETFVATVEDGRVLEGFVDLTVRDADGGVTIVDYKTDAVPAGALGARTQYYAPQLRAYARALRDAGADVRRAVLLFLHPEGAVERDVDLTA